MPAPVDPLALDPLSPIEICLIDDTYCAFTPDHVTPSACAGLRREFAFSGMLLGRAVAHAPMA